jgi:hypothetical protein
MPVDPAEHDTSAAVPLVTDQMPLDELRARDHVVPEEENERAGDALDGSVARRAGTAVLDLNHVDSGAEVWNLLIKPIDHDKGPEA